MRVGLVALVLMVLAARASAQPAARSDDAWAIYQDAFAALVRGDDAKARELLHTLVGRDHPASARAAAVLAALDPPPGEAVTITARVRPKEAPTSGARAELVLFQTLHGIAVGGELCVVASCDAGGSIVGLALIGGGLGAGVSLLATAHGVTAGDRNLVDSGTGWGAINAGMLLGIAEPDDGATIGLGLLAGQAIGTGVGIGLHRTHATAGQVALVNTFGAWSGAIALGALGTVSQDSDSKAYLGVTLGFADAGLVAGALVAKRNPQVSRGQTLVIDAGGIVGGLVGGGLSVVVKGDSDLDRATIGLATAGAAIGLGAAAYLTRHWSIDEDVPVRAALVPRKGGAVAMFALDL